jgi:GR25 family glycosyltransferase involved in LPS biosynthesis
MTRVVLTAIKNRSNFVDYLKSHIPDLEVVWDTTHNAMDTFIAACRYVGNDPVLRLEDDICLTKDFVNKAERAISQRPNEVIQFFSRSKDDLLIGSRYKAGGSFSMNQCVYHPQGISFELANFYDSWQRKDEHPTGTDLMMGDYFRTKNMRYWVHTPSLCNHAPIVSQIDRRRSSKRQAKLFVEPELTNYPLKDKYENL